MKGSCSACILGLYALNLIDDFASTAPMIGHSQQYDPDPKSAKIYKQLLPIFLSISSKLGPEYDSISHFQRQFTSS